TLYFLPKLCRAFRGKCFVINVSSLLRELILHACKFEKLKKRTAQERRIVGIIVDQLRSVESVPLQLPHPSDFACRSCGPQNAGKGKRPEPRSGQLTETFPCKPPLTCVDGTPPRML